MSYEPSDNSGTLGRNLRATTDRHPTHKGACTIGGVEYWISAWTKTRKTDGSRFFSLAFEPKQASADAAQAAQAPRSAPAEPRQGQTGGRAPEPPLPFDDDLPF